ncbi:hypothetical protein ACFLTH_10665 [Bacteroidota bacterium]
MFAVIEFLANDALQKHLSTEFTPFVSELPKTKNGSLDELYQYFCNMNLRLLRNYRDLFFENYINPYWGEKYLNYSSSLLEINKECINKFVKEWEEIAKELQLAKEDFLDV